MLLKALNTAATTIK